VGPQKIRNLVTDPESSDCDGATSPPGRNAGTSLCRQQRRGLASSNDVAVVESIRSVYQHEHHPEDGAFTVLVCVLVSVHVHCSCLHGHECMA